MASSVSSLLSGLGTNTGLNSSGTTNTGSNTGLGQGINVSSFVQAAEAAQETQINGLQAQRNTINSKSSTLATITGDLAALQTSVNALNDPLGVLSNELATSSNPSAVTANASGSAVPGTHTISITSLATTSSYYSDPVTTSSTPLATGDTLAISAGGTPVVSVTVGSTNNTLAGLAAVINSQAATYQSDSVATPGTALATGDTIAITASGAPVASVTVNSTNNTLTQIAAAINAQTTAVKATVITDANGAHLSLVNTASAAPANLTVSGTLHRVDTSAINFTQQAALNASIIQDANGARLAIVSNSSGTPGNLTLTATLHQTGGTAINFTQASAGLNAVLSVDSVPISSATNQVNNVINGVTLNLTGPTPIGTPASLTVSPDTASISTGINNFVTAYNTAINAINAQFAVGSGGSAQPLEADGSLRDVQQQLLSAITYSTAGAGGAVNLASLGITTNNDGTLSVDSGALSNALSSNFSGVQNFFQAASTGFAQNLNTVLNNLNGPANGELTLDSQSYTQSSTALGTQITDLQANLAVQTQNLTAVYSQVNTTLEELPLLQEQLSQQLSTVA
ncbi:MAG TPA: flagellar filament capping protein FliD [Candidatus Acidoferrum sp.]|jgi:flagellar hook-associated protein 2|nr:flagellar filament capping protein FliD [Candidatus Acidoferrum sp.]